MILIPFSCAITASVTLVPIVGYLARARGWIAKPKPDRWHERPTALMGGVAIWLATAFGLAMWFPHPSREWGVFAAGSLLFALGAIDDLLEIKPATKIVAQLVAAAVVVTLGYRFTFFTSHILNLAFSFVWIVAITNAVNLLDNMDGLAAGVVLIAASYVGLGLNDAPNLQALAFALAGSLVGFLVYNFNPATIFMGDSGSMFIGFTLAVLALSNEGSSVLSFVAVPATTLMVPILDTTLVTATRLLRGQSIAEGGRDHTSHRLVRLGLTEREAVSLLWLLAVVAGACAALTEHYSYALGLGLLPVIIIGFGILGVYLSRLSFVDEHGEADESRGYVKLAIDISYKRRVLEVLLDFLLIVVSYYLAYGLRFEFKFPREILACFHDSLPLVVAATMLAFFYEGVYRGVWTYMSADDLVKYLRAVTLAMLLSVFAVILVYRFDGYPRSVFVLYGMLMFLGVGGTRVSFRLMDEWGARRRPGRPVLVVGAGSGGEMIVRELLRNRELGLRVLGFADDDGRKHGRHIHGYAVLGGTDDLDRIHEQLGFEEIIVSTRKISEESADRVRSFCDRAHVPVRLLRIDLVTSDDPHEREWRASL